MGGVYLIMLRFGAVCSFMGQEVCEVSHSSTEKVSLRLTGFCCSAVLQEAIIGGLHAETTYSVTVAAYTTKGDGARSKAKVITTTGAGQRQFYGFY